MLKVFFATKNLGKVDFVRKILGEEYNIRVIHAGINLSEEKADCVEEVAKKKVASAYRQLSGQPCIALDSGLYINSLNGFPGTEVNFVLETLGIEKILRCMKEEEDRSCIVVPCLAYFDKNFDSPVTYESFISGAIAREPRGVTKPYHWSDLARIFVPDGYDKTEAEMTENEYNEWRKTADNSVREFGEFFRELHST